eukprot:9484747-Pyramimonas_sp.AAC.1
MTPPRRKGLKHDSAEGDNRGYVDPYPRIRGVFKWTKHWGPGLYDGGASIIDMGASEYSPLGVYRKASPLFGTAPFFVEASGDERKI